MKMVTESQKILKQALFELYFVIIKHRIRKKSGAFAGYEIR